MLSCLAADEGRARESPATQSHRKRLTLELSCVFLVLGKGLQTLAFSGCLGRLCLCVVPRWTGVFVCMGIRGLNYTVFGSHQATCPR